MIVVLLIVISNHSSSDSGSEFWFSFLRNYMVPCCK